MATLDGMMFRGPQPSTAEELEAVAHFSRVALAHDAAVFSKIHETLFDNIARLAFGGRAYTDDTVQMLDDLGIENPRTVFVDPRTIKFVWR